MQTSNSETPLLLSSALFWSTVSSAAFAQDIGGVTTELTKNLQTVPTALSIIIYIVGILIAFFGVLHCNKAKRFPQQAEFSTGILAVVIGVLLIFFPVVINWIYSSLGSGSGTISRPSF